MNYAAVILARAGSKGIPGKNIKPIAGQPLILWTAGAVERSDRVEQCMIATNDEAVRTICGSAGLKKLQVVGRSEESATDHASSEQALLEVCSVLETKSIVFIQATSPLVTAEDIDGAVAKFESDNYDSLVSVVRQKRFIWTDKAGVGNPINYEPRTRPRRQEFEGHLVENGAIYIFNRRRFMSEGCRLFGKIAVFEMAEPTYIELDEHHDWVFIETLLRDRARDARLGEARSNIKLFVSDVDGVLTDAGMYYNDQGECAKKFNTRDGMGFELLRKRGVVTCLLTSENSPSVAVRAKKLKIDHVCLGAKDKWAVLRGLMEHLGVKADEVAYIGDDINDAICLENLRVTACPADAVAQVKQLVGYICELPGGSGCVREFADRLLGGASS